MNSNKRISLLLGFSLLLTWIRALAALSGAPPKQKHAEVQEVTSAISTDTTAQADGIYACSPDGKCFIFASQDGRLRYCRADDGTVLHTFYHCSPKALVFSADGLLLACAGGSKGKSGKIKVWDLADGRLLCTLASEVAEAPSLAFSTDGLLLVCTTGRARVSLWEIADGKSRWSVSLNRGVSEIAFTGDGPMVIARCGDRTARALALADGSVLRTLPEKETKRTKL